MRCAVRPRAINTTHQTVSASARTISAIMPPLLSAHHNPKPSHIGKNNAAINASDAPAIPSHSKLGRLRSPRYMFLVQPSHMELKDVYIRVLMSADPSASASRYPLHYNAFCDGLVFDDLIPYAGMPANLLVNLAADEDELSAGDGVFVRWIVHFTRAEADRQRRDDDGQDGFLPE